MDSIGNKIYNLAKKLWPLNRSLTGDGVRDSLQIIKKIIPELKIHEVPSGKKVFDWNIPKEWNVKEAWIKTPGGKKICDFSVNNLHLLGYSNPVHKKLTLLELKEKLYTHEIDNAIPYRTSYYNKDWGFCISKNEFNSLEEGLYEVFIDSELKDGCLTYGELLIKGQTDEEIFFSTYICHPSMANNELSGPCLTTYLAKFILSQKRLKSYRIIFIPETIGSINYISDNLNILKERMLAGFNMTCVGDNRCFSYLPSRNGNTISDLYSKKILDDIVGDYKKYTWLNRASDERQYCSPGVDLPVCNIMRSKFGEYPEYHTSLDDLINVVSVEGFETSYSFYKNLINAVDTHCYPKSLFLCEPNLGKRGLYPLLSGGDKDMSIKLLKNVLSYCDGELSIVEISIKVESSYLDTLEAVNKLNKAGVVLLD